MNHITDYIKEIGRGAKGARDLNQADAETLFAAMLDGQVDELQLGAIIIGLRIKSESNEELLGFKAAMDARTPKLNLQHNKKLIVLPSYNGARRHINLTPLLALHLAQQGYPVLIHARYDFHNRVNPIPLMQALNIPFAQSAVQAEALLNQQNICFINLSNFFPSLDQLLALRSRLGLRNCAHTMVKLLDPAPNKSVRIVSVTHPEYLIKMQQFLQSDQATAMLLRGTEGEVFANPKRCPTLKCFINGQPQTEIEEQNSSFTEPEQAHDNDIAANTIKQILSGQSPMPEPLQLQIKLLKEMAS